MAIISINPEKEKALKNEGSILLKEEIPNAEQIKDLNQGVSWLALTTKGALIPITLTSWAIQPNDDGVILTFSLDKKE